MSDQDKDKLIETLTAQNDDLTKQLAASHAQVKAQDAELTQATTIVADLKKKLADAPADATALPQIKVDKETYELTTDFMYAGQVVTLAVLKENTKLAAELVKQGVGNLRKVSK